MLSRKHHEEVAATIKQEYDHEGSSATAYAQGCRDGIARVARCLGDSLFRDNPQFNRERFMKACGLED